MIMNIYRNINRDNVQFDFVIHKKDELFYKDEILSLGGKLYVMPEFSLKNLFKFINFWRNFFNEHKEYKVIHGHVRSTASIYLLIAKIYGLTTITHSHSTSSGSGIESIIKNIMQFPIRFIADYFFACSKIAGEWLFGKRACKKKNFFIIKNAIEAKKFIFNENTRREQRCLLGLEDKYVIGHVGRFDPPKNHEFIIDIFKSIHNINEDVLLLLIGDGVLKDSIKKMVDNLGLHNSVIFTGVRPDIPDLLQAMDIFLFPSIFEGLGISLIEAQATGLHCIVSETIPEEAHITDLVHSIPQNTPVEIWSDKILKYIDGYERQNMYNNIKTSGYDIKTSSEFLEKFYLELLN